MADTPKKTNPTCDKQVTAARAAADREVAPLKAVMAGMNEESGPTKESLKAARVIVERYIKTNDEFNDKHAAERLKALGGAPDEAKKSGADRIEVVRQKGHAEIDPMRNLSEALRLANAKNDVEVLKPHLVQLEVLANVTADERVQRAEYACNKPKSKGKG